MSSTPQSPNPKTIPPHDTNDVNTERVHDSTHKRYKRDSNIVVTLIKKINKVVTKFIKI